MAMIEQPNFGVTYDYSSDRGVGLIQYFLRSDYLQFEADPSGENARLAWGSDIDAREAVAHFSTHPGMRRGFVTSRSQASWDSAMSDELPDKSLAEVTGIVHAYPDDIGVVALIGGDFDFRWANPSRLWNFGEIAVSPVTAKVTEANIRSVRSLIGATALPHVRATYGQILDAYADKAPILRQP